MGSGCAWAPFGNLSTWDEAGIVHQGQFCGNSLNQDMFGTPSGRTKSMENQRSTVRNSFPMDQSLPLCLSSCLRPQIPFLPGPGRPRESQAQAKGVEHPPQELPWQSFNPAALEIIPETLSSACQGFSHFQGHWSSEIAAFIGILAPVGVFLDG